MNPKEPREFTNEELRQRIAEREQMVDLAISVGGIGMWDWHFDPLDINNEGHLEWSTQMHTLFGTDPETFSGSYKDFEACLKPEYRTAVREAITRTVDHGFPYDYAFELMNGKKIRGKGKVFYNSNRMPARMVGVCIEEKCCEH